MKKRCQGILGLLFGHKFFWGSSWTTDKIVKTDHCQRCGMPEGGWPA